MPLQVQGGKKMHLGLEKDETILGKCFGENIRRMILGSQIANAKIVHFYLFPKEMLVYFNVFSSGMKN